MPELRILGGGAANALVEALAPDFTRRTGFAVKGDFGAVGGMRDRLLAGERPDLVILTAAILKDLGAAGIVEPSTIRDVGTVATAVAVRAGDPMPDVATAAGLRAALLAANAIYFPDPKLATAGIHFLKVITDLGILAEAESRLRVFPNGATAMRALAQAPESRPIGSTQATEIVAIDGVRLIGDLPAPHGLATTYTLGIVAGTPAAAAAAELADALTSAGNAALRREKAFR